VALLALARASQSRCITCMPDCVCFREDLPRQVQPRHSSPPLPACPSRTPHSTTTSFVLHCLTTPTAPFTIDPTHARSIDQCCEPARIPGAAFHYRPLFDCCARWGGIRIARPGAAAARPGPLTATHAPTGHVMSHMRATRTLTYVAAQKQHDKYIDSCDNMWRGVPRDCTVHGSVAQKKLL
jgi:hypothetical protein